jgi:hypothetical protein
MTPRHVTESRHSDTARDRADVLSREHADQLRAMGLLGELLVDLRGEQVERLVRAQTRRAA